MPALSHRKEKRMENTWYLYILRCKDDTLYTGITTDVEKRLEAHRSGKGAKYPPGQSTSGASLPGVLWQPLQCAETGTSDQIPFPTGEAAAYRKYGKTFLTKRLAYAIL